MKRMEKSEEYLGDKKFNLFLEIKNVLVLFLDKKNETDVHEIHVFFSNKFNKFNKFKNFKNFCFIKKKKVVTNGKKQQFYFKIHPFAKEFIETVRAFSFFLLFNDIS